MSSESESVNELDVEASTKPTVVLNENGVYVGINEKQLEQTGFDRDEIIGEPSGKFLASGAVSAGADLQRIISGETVEIELHQKRKDGSTYYSTKIGEPVEIGEETFAKVVEIDRREPKSESGSKNPDSSTFDDIGQFELEQIVKNVRIDGPGGEMPLNAVLLDLAVGHNELEQYKQGALSLYQALDERLIEEEQNNPDSPEARVLEEAKDTAFGLYLRVQRGDLELHGNREGKYKGYFN